MPASSRTALTASTTSSSMIVASARRSSRLRRDDSRCLASVSSLTGTTAQMPLTLRNPAALHRGERVGRLEDDTSQLLALREVSHQRRGERHPRRQTGRLLRDSDIYHIT